MPSYLQFTKEEIERKGGLHTALEIEGQPVLWQEVYDLILSQKKSTPQVYVALACGYQP